MCAAEVVQYMGPYSRSPTHGLQNRTSHVSAAFTKIILFYSGTKVLAPIGSAPCCLETASQHGAERELKSFMEFVFVKFDRICLRGTEVPGSSGACVVVTGSCEKMGKTMAWTVSCKERIDEQRSEPSET